MAITSFKEKSNAKLMRRSILQNQTNSQEGQLQSPTKKQNEDECIGRGGNLDSESGLGDIGALGTNLVIRICWLSCASPHSIKLFSREKNNQGKNPEETRYSGSGSTQNSKDRSTINEEIKRYLGKFFLRI